MPRRDKLELSVLIPAHNEEKRIIPCLQRLTAFLERNHASSEIVISEDGSTDKTIERVDEFKAESHFPITFLHSPSRLGKGGGLKKGIHAARGTYTVFTDTDLPVPLPQITEAVLLLEQGADVVNGSRVMKGSSRDEPFLRRALSRGFHALARLLLGVRWDSQCGFKAVRTIVGREVFERIANPGFAYDVEFLLQAQRLGAKVVEMPVHWHYNKGSSMRLKRDVFGMFKELMRIFVRARFGLAHRETAA